MKDTEAKDATAGDEHALLSDKEMTSIIKEMQTLPKSISYPLSSSDPFQEDLNTTQLRTSVLALSSVNAVLDETSLAAKNTLILRFENNQLNAITHEIPNWQVDGLVGFSFTFVAKYTTEISINEKLTVSLGGVAIPKKVFYEMPLGLGRLNGIQLKSFVRAGIGYRVILSKDNVGSSYWRIESLTTPEIGSLELRGYNHEPAFGWYECSGNPDKYQLTSNQGKVLKSIPTETKDKLGIKVTNQKISVADVSPKNGVNYFIYLGV